MGFRAAVVLLAFVMISCTNQGQNKQAGAKSDVMYMPYNSALKYVQGPVVDGETAAQHNGEPVSWVQLSTNEPALIELEGRWLQSSVEFTNFVMQELVAQGKLPETGITIEFYFPQPENPEKLGVLNNDNVTSTFVGFKERGTLATVNGQKIFEKDLLAKSLINVRLYRDLYTQRMRRLNGIIQRRLLLQASKEKNLGMEELVKSEILTKEITASEDDVRAFAQEKGIAESDLTEDMILRLKEIVKQKQRDELIENYVAQKLMKEPVLVGFSPPQYNIKTPELTDNVPHWGSDSGKSVLYIGHWACENCQGALKFFLDGKEKFKSNIKGSFLYYFPDRDRESRMSAEAAMCIYSQKPEYFWKFIQSSMGAENANSEVAITEAAKNSGADYEAFRQCFLSRKYQQAVDTHLAMVKEMGVFRPPLVVVDGRVFEAPINESEISDVIAKLDSQGSSNKNKMGIFGKIMAFFKGLFS